MNTHELGSNAFSKEQMLSATLFTPQEKDVLNVVLQGDESYTLEEAKQLLELFLNKEVI